MGRKDPVLSMLLHYINGVYKKDTNYDIALKLLAEYEQIPNMTINKMAEVCYVSTASISRFIRLLGYETCTDFKKACRKTLHIKSTDYSVTVSKAKRKDMEPILQGYTNNVIDNIKFTFDNIEYQQMDRICQMLFDAKEIALFGLEFSSLLGSHFQNRMALMNKYVNIGFSSEKQLEIAQSLGSSAVVIIASIEGGYFYRNDEIISVLKEKKCKMIALTMNPQNKLMREVNEVLLCSKHNNDTEGRVSLLYMLEIILMYYCINFSQS